VEAPARSAGERWRGRLRLLLVMARGLTAFLTYVAAATGFDRLAPGRVPVFGSAHAAVLWIFAVLMPVGALVRFVYVYHRGAIPRRQQLL
jgi:hypothetical protein